jgi:hypothetical protein
MATDYFTMMRDAVGSYGEGLDLARARRKSDAEEARKETLFNQEQEQYQRKRGIQQGTDAAFGSYKALQNGVYDGSKADFGAVNPAADAGPVPDVAPIGAVGGGAIPKRAASRRDMLDARKNIAVAAQDYGSLGKLEEESRGVEWDDTFAKHYKSYSGSPEQIADAAKHINTNSKAITLHEPDKQGFRQMSVVSPDGTATLLKLGKHDQAQLWAASQMMDLDPQKALAIMHGIDKNLAAAVAAENGIVDKVGQHQNTMAYNKGQLAEAQQRTAIAATSAGTHAKLAGLQMDEIKNAQKRREDAGAIVAEYNGLTDAEKTGDKGRALVTKFNILNAKNGGQVSFQTPKGSGKTPMDVPVDIKQNGDGGFVAFEKDGGNPLYNIGPNGDKRPLGMSAADHAKLMKDASAAGTPVVEGYDGTGKFTLRVQGRDGKYYSSVQEAATAKPAKALPAAGAASSPSGPAYDWNAPLVPGGVSPPRFGIPQPKGMRTLDDRL